MEQIRVYKLRAKLIFDKDAKAIQWGKNNFFQQKGAKTTGFPDTKKNSELQPLLHITHKNELKMERIKTNKLPATERKGKERWGTDLMKIKRRTVEERDQGVRGSAREWHWPNYIFKLCNVRMYKYVTSPIGRDNSNKPIKNVEEKTIKLSEVNLLSKVFALCVFLVWILVFAPCPQAPTPIGNRARYVVGWITGKEP